MKENNVGKHPTALPYLFLTEMWERFGYYLMLGIFSLYMIDSVDNGGMGFAPSKKSDIYGTYLGLVYLTPFIGGLLADRLLGYRKSIIIGGLLMAAGYMGLAMKGETIFYISLLCIILGNGFFKPNISTLLGNLYNEEPYKDNKDSGYNIFYMGINIGAFVCNFVAAYMRINYGWGWAFAAAGVGMLIGIVIFIMGSKHVKKADVLKPLQPGDMPTGKILLLVLLPMFVFGVLGYLIPGNIFGTDTNDAFLIGCIPVILFFVYLLVKANAEDKRPIGALLAVYACLVVFWAIFHQNGDALTIWAEEYTDRSMPAGMDKALSSVDLAQTVSYTDYVNYSDGKFDSLVSTMKGQKAHLDSLGTEISKAESQKIGKEIGYMETSRKYFSNLPADKRPALNTDLKLISAELYQSINPFWVIILTPLVVGFFGMLRRRKREPSTPAKIAIGLLITALSALVMVLAVRSVNLETEKATSLWLVMSYGVITIGELCLSPMGLSLVSKLSPPRITALMMGGFFLSTSVGNKLSGILSSMWESYEDKSYFFITNFFLVLPAAIIMFVLLRWLNSVMKEKGVL
jgi:POT family proton-dependent oligopeptide transporter